jgi:hypothetical protein
VQVDDAGEDDSQQLAHSHDDDEDDGPKLGDGVVDKQLAKSRTQ